MDPATHKFLTTLLADMEQTVRTASGFGMREALDQCLQRAQAGLAKLAPKPKPTPKVKPKARLDNDVG